MITNLYTNMNRKFLLYSIPLILLSIATMTLTSRNSPMYLFNDWVDLNAFMTVGKGWLHGMVPYRDLFEQKGPILFFFFLIANMISKTYFGIFIIEILMFFISLTLTFKISRKYLGVGESFLVCAFMSWVLTISPFFQAGGSAEELSFPFILYSIYLLLCVSEKNFEITNKQSYFAGFCFAMLFWIKFTLVGGYLAAFIFLIGIFTFRKQFYSLISMMIFSLLGFLTVTIPIILYFSINNAMNDLIFSYFISNIKLYPNNSGATIIWKILNSIFLYFKKIDDIPVLFFLLIPMLIYLIISNTFLKNDLTKFVYCAMYLGLIVSVFFGGKTFDYYYLALFPFSIIPIIGIIKLLDTHVRQSIGSYILLLLFSFVLMIGFNTNFLASKLYPNNKSYQYSQNYSGPFQGTFSKIILKNSDKTLLNYGSLDIGLYHATDVLPVNKYFHKVNIPDQALPKMMNEQNSMVRNKKVAFVVLRTPIGSKEESAVPKLIRDNYKLITTQDQSYLGSSLSFTYRLYKVK